jgi:hypothetical protein
MCDQTSQSDASTRSKLQHHAPFCDVSTAGWCYRGAKEKREHHTPFCEVMSV